MFSKAKRGDNVWHFSKGWGIVLSVEKRTSYPLTVKFEGGVKIAFLLDGRQNRTDINPSLFWSELELKNDKDDEDKEIMDFLKERLEPLGQHEFCSHDFITYTYTTKSWYINSCSGCVDLGKIMLKPSPRSQVQEVSRYLTSRKISYEKMLDICRKLGWL